MSDRALSLVGKGSNPDGRPDTDFYATPSWATCALLDREPFGYRILEPACGDGAIAKVLIARNHATHATDLYPYGYGMSGVDFVTDYKESNLLLKRWWDAIVTNPPYRLAEEFLAEALRLTAPVEGKVALLLKLQFLEGQKRKSLLQNSPLSKVYVFSKRLTFTRNNKPIGNSGMMAFAWYVWDWKMLRASCQAPHIEWI